VIEVDLNIKIDLINLIGLISNQIPNAKSQFGHFDIRNCLGQLEIRVLRNLGGIIFFFF